MSDPDAIDEIFAHGFRNPFRITVDRDTNDIYAGDVGNNDIEEVDLITAGNNYDFPIKEGSFCFVGAGGPPDGSPGVEDPSTCADISVGLIDPLASDIEANQSRRVINRPGKCGPAATNVKG